MVNPMMQPNFQNYLYILTPHPDELFLRDKERIGIKDGT
jgi:hypothetical protein